VVLSAAQRVRRELQRLLNVRMKQVIECALGLRSHAYDSVVAIEVLVQIPLEFPVFLVDFGCIAGHVVRQAAQVRKCLDPCGMEGLLCSLNC